ncbi:MAG TPA: thermonuclease family protein, partial [Sphingomicrobium sp.]|nr:thermonuclease family protein [Sphingomicrobium sp.]
RIAGMDAPETHPPRCMREAQLGLAATAKLEQLLESGTVTMGPATRDKYGRELRQVFVNGVDVAQTMIAAGLASSYEGKKRQSWC